MGYYCQHLNTGNIGEHTKAYYSFHVHLQQLNGKTYKTFELFSKRVNKLLQLPNRKVYLIYNELTVIGWLAIEIYEAANGQQCFELTGDLRDPVTDTTTIQNFSAILHQWKTQFNLQHGFLKVTGPPKMHLCTLLNGQLLDEQQYFKLKIADANFDILSGWANNVNVQALHEIFSVAVPEKYLAEFVLALNAGLNDIPTAMNIFTRHSTIEVEKKNIVDRLADNRRHLILMLVNKDDKIAAITNLTIFSNNKTAKQWLTYVHPNYRGARLAKYLKAKMLIKIKENYPAITDIETDCYKANTIMIDINRKMEFSYTRSVFDYKISL